MVLAFPALLCLLVPVLAALPGCQDLALTAGFRLVPYFTLVLSLTLGLLFTQSRVSYLSIVMGVAVLLMDLALRGSADRTQLRACILLGTLVVPCFSAILYHLNERGVLTPYGGVRATLVVAAGLFMTVVTLTPGLGDAVVAAESHVLRPVSSLVRLPVVGVLVFAGCVPALLRPREHESPALGSLLAISVLLFLGGMNCQSSLWSTRQAQTAAFVFAMASAGIGLCWAVLMNAWWHANMDALTQLPSRRRLEHHFRCLGSKYVIAVLDLDHFKQINDTFGHDVGDQVLRFVGRQLRFTTVGSAYRYGGEEFVIVAEGRELETVAKDLDALRQSIARKEFCVRGSDRPSRKSGEARRSTVSDRTGDLRLTVSIGVAASGRRRIAPREVVEAADQALYTAKREGRNRVCTAR
jgi:GGDEF domain-containing protein